jgi:hypothetical protein
LGFVSALATVAAADPEPVSKIILGIAVGLASFFAKFIGKGCGQTCVQATQIVDTVERDYLKPNLAAYMNAPTHFRSNQVKALEVFDYAWSQVLAGCGDPALQAAGRRCISERERGGTAPWCPTADHRGCDWFTLYRDPIANDPNVVDDPAPKTVGETISRVVSGSTAGVPNGLLLIGGIAAVAFMFMSGGDN